MCQRNKHLPRSAPVLADKVLHDRVAAGKAALVAQALEDLLRRVPAFAVAVPILVQNAIDDAHVRIEPWTSRRSAPPIARWKQIHQHLGYCLAVDPKPSRRFSSAQSLMMTCNSYTPILIHSDLSPAFDQVNSDKGYRRSTFGPPFRPSRSAASVGYNCASVFNVGRPFLTANTPLIGVPCVR